MIYYTIDDVMDIMSVSHQTVYNWFDKGLKKTKIGKNVRIKEEDLKKFISDQE